MDVRPTYCIQRSAELVIRFIYPLAIHSSICMLRWASTFSGAYIYTQLLTMPPSSSTLLGRSRMTLYWTLYEDFGARKQVQVDGGPLVNNRCLRQMPLIKPKPSIRLVGATRQLMTRIFHFVAIRLLSLVTVEKWTRLDNRTTCNRLAANKTGPFG